MKLTANRRTIYNVAEKTFEFHDDFPNIFKDDEGNVWDAFSTAISGPATGEQMDAPILFIAQWWAWIGIYTSFDHLGVK